jgi:hypothetical protein
MGRAVKLYLRILAYLGSPTAGSSSSPLLATSIFAALDAFSLALLIPFLRTLFAPQTGAGAARARGLRGRGPRDPDARGGRVDLGCAPSGRFVGRFVDLGAPPADAMQGIILFLLVVFLVKNVFDFLRNYLVAWIEQAV